MLPCNGNGELQKQVYLVEFAYLLVLHDSNTCIDGGTIDVETAAE
jgi:hypothetical protein